MKKISRKTTLLLTLVLAFSFMLQGMTVYAAAAKRANFSVSKDGETFKLKKGKKSYSFRYDWDDKEKAYTGYNQKKINKIAPWSAKSGLHMSFEHEGSSPEEATIVVLEGVTLNKKIYRGMTLAQFHKKIKSAWGEGYYGYWSSKRKKTVRIGSNKPTNSYVKKRSKDTGLFWAGTRGRLAINVSITWNKEKKRAEVGWIEMWVRERSTD